MEIKNKRPSHQELKKEALEKPEVRKEYDRLAPFYEKIKNNLKKGKGSEKRKSRTACNCPASISNTLWV